MTAGDGALWERFDRSTTLLLGIQHGTVSSQLFSDVFMDPEQVFRPYTQQR